MSRRPKRATDEQVAAMTLYPERLRGVRKELLQTKRPGRLGGGRGVNPIRREA